jgi:hypothetical protein
VDRGDDNARLAQTCLSLKRRLVRLAGRMSSAFDAFTKEVDAIAYDLEQCLAALAEGSTGANGNPRPSSRVAAEHQVLEEQAAVGAAQVETRPRAGGSIDVRIDGRKWLRLPPMPAELLRILLESGQTMAADRLPTHRSYDEIAARLSKRLGRSVARDDVTQVVHKLRRAFRDAGENWFLIQTHRTRGIRFALRPPPSAESEDA